MICCFSPFIFCLIVWCWCWCVWMTAVCCVLQSFIRGSFTSFLLQMYKDRHTFYVMEIFLVKKETELICSHHLSLWIFVFGSILVFLARGYKCRSSTHTHCNSHLFISVHLFVSNGDECCETPHKMSHSWNAQRQWWWNVTIYIH